MKVWVAIEELKIERGHDLTKCTSVTQCPMFFKSKISILKEQAWALGLKAYAEVKKLSSPDSKHIIDKFILATHPVLEVFSEPFETGSGIFSSLPLLDKTHLWVDQWCVTGFKCKQSSLRQTFAIKVQPYKLVDDRRFFGVHLSPARDPVTFGRLVE